MPILNYTTKIDQHKTVGEIQGILARAGATAVTVDYDTSRYPVAVSFSVDINGRLVPFRLPTNRNGVLVAMKQDDDIPSRFKAEEQARRVAWRIVKDWVEAQMAFIESNQATLAQLFLPHVVRGDGRTFYEEIESSYLMLGDGGG